MQIEKSNHQIKRCVFEATLGCNLNCSHCGSRAGVPRPDELTVEEASNLFSQLAQLGCKRVTISGGEVLTRNDWPELVEAAAATGMRVAMITNGILFDDAAAKTARELGLGAVGFSLDGIGRVHDRIRGRIGHFKMVEEAIDSARCAELPFSLLTQVNRLNIGQLADIHDFARDHGAYAWQVQLGTDMGNMCDNPELPLRARDLPRLESNLSALIRRDEITVAVANSIGYFGKEESTLRKGLGGHCFGGCAAGVRNLGIESNGDIKGCLAMMPGPGDDPRKYVEGNIRTQRLADIWRRADSFAYNRLAKVEDLTGSCRDCASASKCMGGCRASMIATGAGTENPMCVLRASEDSPATAALGGGVAAAILASVLGASGMVCDHVDRDDETDTDDPDGGNDADTDTDTDTDTDSDTDTDADTDTDTDTETGSDVDTDVDSDTDAYDIPPWP